MTSDGERVVVVPIIDMGSGLWLFSGVLAAIIERGKTGRGARVGVSLLETGVAWTTLHMSNYMATGEVPERTGSASPAAAPYEAVETSDLVHLDPARLEQLDVLG